jgi:hypothetical protein
MAGTRYKVIVDVGDAAGAKTFAKLVAAPDWQLDPIATDAAPGDLSVLTLRRPLEPSDVTGGMTAIRELLGTDDLASAGIKTEFATLQPDGADSSVRLMASGGGGHLPTLLGPAFGPPPVVVQVGGQAANGEDKEKARTPGDATPPEPSAQPESAAQPGVKQPAGDGNGASSPEATIAAVETVLGDPEKIWRHLGADKDELAAEQIRALYADRAQFARRSQWALAPELALLELVTEEERPVLASHVLEVRANLTASDESLRASHADLAAKRVELDARRVELEGERVALAHEGIETAKEMRRHMVRWRKLAGLAPWFLAATTLFAMAAIGYMLVELMPGDDVSDVAAPIAIFALAVFAISPAVLLLLERPLKGLDDWMPGGKPSGEKDESGTSSGSSAKDGSGSTGNATAPPATAPADAPGSPS